MRLAPALPVLLTLAACGPATQPPVRVMGLALSTGGRYEPTELELKTVEDIVALKGTVAHLIGGARIEIDPEDPALQVNGGNLTDEALEAALLKSRGRDVRASYIEKPGMLWPADFHTWNMVTTYFNFEKSFEYFQSAYGGADATELTDARVYYFPAFIEALSSPDEQRDNAAFISPLDGFAILPFEQLQAIPLSINTGVVGHEYAHRVFNLRVHRGQSVPEPYLRWATTAGNALGLNTLSAIDEGLADFHGFSVTCNTPFGCNPRFFLSSIGEAATEARDLSKANRCLSATLDRAMRELSEEQFSGQGLNYAVGTVLASALYQAAGTTPKLPLLQRAVVAAYADEAGAPGLRELIETNLDNPDAFNLASVSNAIVAHITDPALKARTCGELADRLRLCASFPCPELPDCPIDSPIGTACP